MDSPTEPNNVVKSDQTVFAIIEYIHREGDAGVTELADSLGLAKSSVHKHLKTLAHHDYVVNDGGRYRLGLKFLTLGGRIRDGSELCQFARASVTELAEETNQMVSFILRDGSHGVAVFVRNDRYGLRKQVPLGNRFPLYQNGAGKSILAALPDDELEGVIERTTLEAKTPNTITSVDVLRREIEEIRDRGYATSTEERVEGVQSVASAVEDRSGGTIGSLSIAGPADRLTEERLHAGYADAVMEAANELELRIRYSTD